MFKPKISKNGTNIENTTLLGIKSNNIATELQANITEIKILLIVSILFLNNLIFSLKRNTNIRTLNTPGRISPSN